MTDEIRPALTAEEWADAAGNEGPSALERSDLWAQLSPGRLLVLRTPGDRSCLVSDDDAQAVIALANAALPDGDPRKITREDVSQLRRDAFSLESEYGDDAASELRAIAAKLAALLPPEPT